MDCNKEEAVRARELAEKKLGEKDYIGAQKLALKAQRLYPQLENLSQLMLVCDVHSAAETKINGQFDWYKILQVEQTADDITIKKQYRKLALYLHPDKNKFIGAEAAFKLIVEANMTLSDVGKRTAYDLKIAAAMKMTQPTLYGRKKDETKQPPPPQQQQQQQQHSSFGSTFATFWTACPACNLRYQYYRTVLNKGVRCQRCTVVFVASEVNPQAATSGSNLNTKANGGNGAAQQAVPAPPAHNRTSSVSNSGLRKDAIRKEGVPIAKANLHGDAQCNATRNEGTPVAKANPCGDAQCNATRKEGLPVAKANPNGDAHCNTTTKEATPVAKANLKDDGQCNEAEELVSSSLRRSSRKRRNVYADNKDGDAVIASSNTRPRTSVPSADSEPPIKKVPASNGDNFNSVKVEKNANAFIPPSGLSDGKADDEDPKREREGRRDGEGVYSYPDSDFHDFEKFRDISRFRVDQIWALYDNLDGMPRFYARIRRVDIANLKVQYTWLEHYPVNKVEEAWDDEDLPVACGQYKLGKTEVTQDMPMFSHVASWAKGKQKSSYEINPRKGEVWAIFKDWSINWSSDAENHRLFSYDVVEVLSDLACSGIKVSPLVRIKGFVSLFARAKDRGPFIIPGSEMLKFSHYVPRYRTTGTETERKAGVTGGFLELDIASLPCDLDETFFTVTLADYLAETAQSSVMCNGTPFKPSSNGESSHCQDSSMERPQPVSANRNIPAPNKDSDTDRLSVPPSPTPSYYEYPDSEFYNFEELRSKEKFETGQVWALYSDFDQFPKYYGWIRRVDQDPFQIHAVWLECCPQNDEAKRYLKLDIPVSCGTFKVANWQVEYDAVATFSHQVVFSQCSKKNHYTVLPSVGEVWAMYQNWAIGWSPENFANCEFDIVEICDGSEDSTKVAHLVQVGGYRAVFRFDRERGETEIPKQEYLRFSHRIPAFRLSEERGGKLRDCIELDPACLPLAFLFRDN